MLKPENNMKTMEKVFPEVYGLVKGHWYEHIASGSIALYKGDSPTFGINPLGFFGKKPPKDWHMSFYNNWYGSYSSLGRDWTNVDMDHVIDMFKQHLGDKRDLKIGACVYYNKHGYAITDDWYFDGDRLMAVCINDVGSNTHLMLLSSEGINECIVPYGKI